MWHACGDYTSLISNTNGAGRWSWFKPLYASRASILNGMAWHGMAWDGTARHGTARHDTTRHKKYQMLPHWGWNKMPVIFQTAFSNVWTSRKISLKFVPKVRIHNIPALVQIIVWRRPGGKPLSEPMLVSLLTHICATPPQWVKPPYASRESILDGIS